MNVENGFNLIKKGFHVSLGATTSLLESIQDPRKGEEALNQLRTDPNALAERLAERGAETEVEARKFVDSMMGQYSSGTAAPTQSSPSVTTTTPVDPEIQKQLKDLTAELAAIRSQLDTLS